jgi:hypothetical protein
MDIPRTSSSGVFAKELMEEAIIDEVLATFWCKMVLPEKLIRVQRLLSQL